MKTIASPARMQALSRRIRQGGQRIGFVPTMGYLHEGHLDLVRRAKARSDVVVVSIFVNKTQFAAGEDFEAYPRNLRRDLRLLRPAGADIVFHPRHEDLYSDDASVQVEETRLSRTLCGQYRPGHFRGVTTVVAKLFNIVLPDIAVFGQKDAQQALVIRRMVRDLNIPVRILVAPTVREPDGLAMSSRNSYLSPDERRQAVCLWQALQAARGALAGGATDEQLSAMIEYGMKIGLGFQIADDLLDITASSEQLGKTAGKDAEQGKLTYPALVGEEKSREIFEKLTCEAVCALQIFGKEAETLRQLAMELLDRTK